MHPSYTDQNNPSGVAPVAMFDVSNKKQCSFFFFFFLFVMCVYLTPTFFFSFLFFYSLMMPTCTLPFKVFRCSAQNDGHLYNTIRWWLIKYIVVGKLTAHSCVVGAVSSRQLPWTRYTFFRLLLTLFIVKVSCNYWLKNIMKIMRECKKKS